MSRIEINFPPSYIFQIEVPLRKIDTDYGLHIGFDKYFSLVGEGYYQFMHKFNIAPNDIFASGITLVFGDAHIQYISELYFNDVVNIESTVGDFSSKTFYYYTQIWKKQKSQLAAKSRFTVLCMDQKTHKATTIPDRLLSVFREGGINV